MHWYGIAYAVGLGLSIWILTILNKKRCVFKNDEQIFDFVFWIFLGGILLGGRLGYVLFYNLSFYLEHPIEIPAVWKGGMSFHGGLIGTGVVTLWLNRKHKMDLLRLTDLIVVPAGLATGIGRLANFVNRELYGRVIENANWQWLGIDFGDGLLRYPSQLFQAGSEMLIFVILLLIFRKNPKKGILTFCYLMLYGLFRFLIEFFREPDTQIGYLFQFLTLGQLLSLGMVLVGMIGIFINNRDLKSSTPKKHK